LLRDVVPERKFMLENAIIIATKSHKGQFDKIGEPYILHPLRVMMAVQGIQCRVVAILHDVLEDTTVTKEDLLKEFPIEIVNSLVNISKI
jgi:GTP diphosphokinase / guanosine-3',5'-bis(diphosphate) 3'-diphosphatase